MALPPQSYGCVWEVRDEELPMVFSRDTLRNRINVRVNCRRPDSVMELRYFKLFGQNTGGGMVIVNVEEETRLPRPLHMRIAFGFASGNILSAAGGILYNVIGNDWRIRIRSVEVSYEPTRNAGSFFLPRVSTPSPEELCSQYAKYQRADAFWLVTPLEKEALSAAWSSELRRKVEAQKEADREAARLTWYWSPEED